MNKKVMIFDFDGTIADSTMKVYEVLNDLAPEYGIDRVGIDRLSELREHDYSEILSELRVPKYKMPFIYLKFKKEFKKIVKELKPIPGIKSVVKKLHENNNLYIVSSNTKEVIGEFLDINDLNYFSQIVGGATLLGKSKKIEKILKNESGKVNKSNVYYIGDEIRDVNAAKKSGINSVAVTWGFNTKTALRRRQPDYIIDKPDQLLTLY